MTLARDRLIYARGERELRTLLATVERSFPFITWRNSE